jgi:hypothetical protein
MKKTLITSLLTIVSFLGTSQSTAIKMKLRYWNKPEQNFNQSLTKNGKILLDSILTISKIDTSKCIKVDRKDIIEYTSQKYLSNQKYLYLNYAIWNDRLDKKQFQNFKHIDNKVTPKVVLYHSTGEEIDTMTLLVIY